MTDLSHEPSALDLVSASAANAQSRRRRERFANVGIAIAGALALLLIWKLAVMALIFAVFLNLYVRKMSTTRKVSPWPLRLTALIAWSLSGVLQQLSGESPDFGAAGVVADDL